MPNIEIGQYKKKLLKIFDSIFLIKNFLKHLSGCFFVEKERL